ncbi:HNH endonuclease signature motif containing protein [Microbacterium sp.]|uniref:HNH endonuclease signature motif containing protein n=1 Tax=Microbacterium sp. TaxID=51671 RepID=UPI0035B4EBF5
MSTAELPASTGQYLASRTTVGPGPDDCWLWTNKPDRDGYGVAHAAGKQWRAHRLSYRFHVGPIPDGHELDHTCEVRLCVRPSHLAPVASNFENFVSKYLRQGRAREAAEQLAADRVQEVNGRSRRAWHRRRRPCRSQSTSRCHHLAGDPHDQIGSRRARCRSRIRRRGTHPRCSNRSVARGSSIADRHAPRTI